MQKVCFIDKPRGMTSFDVCYKMRKVLNTRAVGHTGTLDPNATGVMIILFDKTCKANPFIVSASKEYVATVEIGYETDTLDIDGNVISKMDRYQMPERKEIENVLRSFLGKSTQKPPMTSAIKIKGKKLYDYQRQNIEVEIPEREIEVFDIELLNVNQNMITFKANVSSGTYIRSLMRDILTKMGLIGTLSKLRRTRVDNIGIESCDSLEDALNGNIHFHDLKELLTHRYPIYECDERMTNDIKNGKTIKLNEKNEFVCMVKGDEVLAIYEYQNDGLYHSKRGLF